MQSLFRRTVAVCFLVLALVLASLVFLSPRLFLNFLSSYQSSSSIVAQRTSITILAFVISIAGLIFAAGIVLFRRPIRPQDLLRKLLEIDGEMGDAAFHVNVRWLVGSSTLAVFVILLYLSQALFPESETMHFIYREDGFFETLTAVLGVGAGALYVALAVRLHRLASRANRPSIIAAKVLLVLAACACILYALEEISWGQRVFGWQTPATLAESNYQGETNLHNRVGILPMLLNWGLTAYCAITVISWLGGLRRHLPWIGLLLPHTCMSLLVFLGMFATGEIQEQLVALLLFLHTLRGFISTRAAVRL